MIKIKSRNPKSSSSGSSRRDRDQERRRVTDENRRNKRRTLETGYKSSSGKSSRSSKSGSRKKFTGEEHFTFSLDGLIPAYGDPSQVSKKIFNIFFTQTRSVFFSFSMSNSPLLKGGDKTPLFKG